MTQQVRPSTLLSRMHQPRLNEHALSLLEERGIRHVGTLQLLSEEELLSLEGIGNKLCGDITLFLNQHSLTLRNSTTTVQQRTCDLFDNHRDINRYKRYRVQALVK